MGAFKRAVNLFYFFSSRKAVESSVVTRTGQKDEVPTSGSLPTGSLLDVGVGHAELGLLWGLESLADRAFRE